MDLDAIYASHPLNERTILARLDRQGIPLSGLREWSLAIDPDTDITDQNHAGGVQAVLTLAAAAGVSDTSAVVDIGAGLGGSARVLAEAFDCSVVGVEQDQRRCDEAIRLTALVGLSSRVRFLRHDALSGTADIEHVDVLWGQSAWVHFPSPETFLDLWLPVVRANGRVAMSDAFLLREPAGSEETRAVRSLESLWSAHLVTIDRWRRALEARRCAVGHLHDRSEEARSHFKNCLSVSARWPDGTVTPAEKDSWVWATDLLDRGLIGAMQLVAVRES
jgi:cyclopropane fatty-acyl-phospholipid synthase-like methyltransferase